jgi:hypothetical protein
MILLVSEASAIKKCALGFPLYTTLYTIIVNPMQVGMLSEPSSYSFMQNPN